MLHSTKVAICTCLLLISGMTPSFSQTSNVNETPLVVTYRLPDSLDANTAEDVLETVLSGCDSVRIGLDPSNRNIIASARPKYHKMISDTIAILQKPVRIDAESLTDQSFQSGKYLCVYALDDSMKTIAKMVVESLLADKNGVKLHVDPKTSNLIVMASAPEHRLIATSLAELSRNSPDSKQLLKSAGTESAFSIHSLGNSLILLNSDTGDTWILVGTNDAESPAWTRINRDK